jgi:hypothetical protein
LIKTDENGIEQWNKTFGGLFDDFGADIEQTTDSGYIIVGRYEFAYYDRVGWLIKTDCDGNLKWEKKYQDYRLNRVHQTNDEGFIIAGVTNRFLLLLKVDKDGNEIWSKNFSYNEPTFYIFGVEQTSDGGYILTGGHFLIKTDGNGIEEWHLEFDENMEGTDVLQNSDGGYTVVGYIGDWPRNLVGWMIIINSDGEILHSRKYGGVINSFRPLSIYQTTDGGYILTGESNRDPLPFGRLTLRLWLAKTDRVGRLIWSRRYGYSYESGFEAQQTSDGGYIVVGFTNSYGDSVDVWLIKTGKLGFARQPTIYMIFLEFLETLKNNPQIFPLLQKILDVFRLDN